MKPYLYSLIAAAAACGLAQAQSTAYTTPVGYVSLGNTAGDAVPADTDFYISVPGLDRAAEASGLIASVSGADINFQGAPALPSFTGGVPYVAKIVSGSKSGIVALITANDADTVTLALQSGETLAGISAGDKIQVQKAWTPASLFAGVIIPDGTQILGFSGASSGTNLSADITYEYGGGSWFDLATFTPADNNVIYPNEGFIVRTIPGSPIASMVLSGTVSTSNSRILIANMDANGQDNILAFNSPIAESLSDAGLGVNSGDQILVSDNSEVNGVVVTPGTNKSSVITLEYTAGSPGTWTDLGTFADVTNSYMLQPGQSFIYRTVAGAPLVDTAWTNQPNYVSNLQP